MKALIFAAGKGTRLKPFTDQYPKALAKVNGIPLLERNIKYLQSFGINDFVINIHHFGNQILDFLKENNYFDANIEISDETNELLETGGGMMFARPFLEKESHFLVMNADILTNLDITKFVDFHLSSNRMVTLAVSDRKSSRKLLFDQNKILCGWTNKNTGELKLSETNNTLKELAFSGIHCISSEIFSRIKRKGKFSIIDEYLDLMNEKVIIGYEHDALLIDVGKPEAITEAEKYFL
ncbi:nucleotidyltransferase family protein [Riemerella anatipestifer]|uniref:nucleotidyltransferase family protein n=1 Tax=Riemerella anatipestifer TaxID=34085 RepID=UPI00069AA249|nr:nucleotidyltransferase family protein [Riemerella anatipestifer]MDY3528368.1 nucleotidyltransferase family protein [Riemerella anatipestifer]